MENFQLYETTVADREQGYTFRFLTISQKSLTAAVQQPAQAKDALVQLLGLQQLQLVQPSSLPQAIMGMPRADDEVEQLQQLQAKAVLAQLLQTTPPPPGTAPPSPNLLAFAEQIAFMDPIPFEVSSIDLVSLAGKAAALATRPIGLGAFIGVIAGGTTPFLLVTVPAGIILCGTAVTFAKWVDAKRDEIMNKLLSIPPKIKQKQALSPAPTPPPTTPSSDE